MPVKGFAVKAMSFHMTGPLRPPELTVQTWLNTESTLTLSKLRGKVIALFAFQLLCPGCVQQSIPQANRVHSTFSQSDLVVIGLHTVFEHHAAMTEITLRAFIHENKISFPVGIDMPSKDDSSFLAQ